MNVVFVATPVEPGPSSLAMCSCPGAGPWSVSLSISTADRRTALFMLTHAECGKVMELPNWLDLDADDVPMVLTLVDETGNGPDPYSWLELTPRTPELIDVTASVQVGDV